MPRQRLAPPSRSVCSMITGLSQGTLDGETASSACRPMKATRAALSGVMPRMGLVALRHHSSCARNACCQKADGEAVPSLVLEAPVPLGGGEWFLVSRSLGGGVQQEAGQSRRRVQGEKRKLHLPTRRASNMRGPFEPGGELGVRRSALSKPRERRPRQPIDRLEGGGLRRRKLVVARLGGRWILARYRPGRGKRRALIHCLKGLPKARGTCLASCQMGLGRPFDHAAKPG